METSPCGRDHAAVATASGGDQPRGETVLAQTQRGAEQVMLRARVHHEAKYCLILTDCSNAFNTVK